ncbi:MAG: cysteine-rich CWC family protein [Pyrinomonadaceae bacterium]|nr:cysteine-rich CWC family protein [Pyrinomonadaceae bacterium]
MIKKAFKLISAASKAPTQCGKCGSDFKCGASLQGCWCMKISLTKDAQAELKQNFTGCLCSECLKDYSLPAD